MIPVVPPYPLQDNRLIGNDSNVPSHSVGEKTQSAVSENAAVSIESTAEKKQKSKLEVTASGSQRMVVQPKEHKESDKVNAERASEKRSRSEELRNPDQRQCPDRVQKDSMMIQRVKTDESTMKTPKSEGMELSEELKRKIQDPFDEMMSGIELKCNSTEDGNQEIESEIEAVSQAKGVEIATDKKKGVLQKNGVQKEMVQQKAAVIDNKSAFAVNENGGRAIMSKSERDGHSDRTVNISKNPKKNTVKVKSARIEKGSVQNGVDGLRPNAECTPNSRKEVDVVNGTQRKCGNKSSSRQHICSNFAANHGHNQHDDVQKEQKMDSGTKTMSVTVFKGNTESDNNPHTVSSTNKSPLKKQKKQKRKKFEKRDEHKEDEQAVTTKAETYDLSLSLSVCAQTKTIQIDLDVQREEKGDDSGSDRGRDQIFE